MTAPYIKRIVYEESVQELAIETAYGNLMVFRRIPRSRFDEMSAAENMDQYYNTHIRGKYECSLLVPKE